MSLATLQKRLKYSDEQVLFCFKKGGLVAEKRSADVAPGLNLWQQSMRGWGSNFANITRSPKQE